jgi:GAF domain-containing protein
VEGRDLRVEEVEAELQAAATVPELMRLAARRVTDLLGGSGCAISRILGDVLVELAEFAGTRPTLYLGHGYLISDYPLTRDAVETREPRSVYVHDPDADQREVELLLELKFESVLMVPICVGETVWGLAEIYREGVPRFVDVDAERAKRVFDLVGERVGQLERAA